MKKLTIFLSTTILLAALSCKKITDTSNQEIPIARVGEQYLYAKELEGFIKPEVSTQDSLMLIKQYAEKWILKQLIASYAINNGYINETDIERRVEEYRNSLIAFEFQNKYIEENLKKEISEQELENFYQANKPNFELKQPIFKGYLVSVSSSNDEQKITKILQQNESNDLHSYCVVHSLPHIISDTNWLSFDEAISNSPFEKEDKNKLLQQTSLQKRTKNGETYLLKVLDYKTKNQDAPLDYVKAQVKRVLLNKRKQALLDSLEQKIYQEAQTNQSFEIWVK
jgi:hypothetical protein